MKYIFDIDGTLTPSRLPIDPKFSIFFTQWIKNKDVYLVTGSDKEKTIEQIKKMYSFSSFPNVLLACLLRYVNINMKLAFLVKNSKLI